METTTPTTKPGYKSSEFWLTLLTQIATLGTALAGLLPPKEAALLLAFSQAAYTISRGIAKSKEVAVVAS